MDLAAAYPKGDVAHGDEAVELLRQAPRFDNEIVRHILWRGWHSGCARFFWAPLCGISMSVWA
jgi:hypothetical protein